jgi:nifR3 family TIM-barrel protein
MIFLYDILISMFKRKVNLGFWGEIRKPIMVSAPMAEVTDIAFRQMLAKNGKPDVIWTEFVSCDGLVKAPSAPSQSQVTSHKSKEFSPQEVLWRDLMYRENERPIVAQIFSSNPKMMKEAAYRVARAGFDGIDINMGCPDRAIQKQESGAALIQNPKRAVQIIRAAKKGIHKACRKTRKEDIPLSVKTRIGYHKDTMEDWLTVLLKEKLALITIHARTKREMSKVPANWERIRDAVKLRDQISPQTLILGNGDVQTLDEAKDKAKEFGCDGVMIGRALMGNPWFFNRALAGGERMTKKQKLEALFAHTELFERYLPHKNFDVMKKHFKAYVRGWKGAKALREKLMQTENSQGLKKVLDL